MLTPLERELLTYVEELTNACEASEEQLKASETALMSLEDRLMKQSKLMSRDLIYTVIALAESQEALMVSWQVLSDGGDLDPNLGKTWESHQHKLQEATNRLSTVFNWMFDEP
jgi:DNA repair ATPase RecN